MTFSKGKWQLCSPDSLAWFLQTCVTLAVNCSCLTLTPFLIPAVCLSVTLSEQHVLNHSFSIQSTLSLSPTPPTLLQADCVCSSCHLCSARLCVLLLSSLLSQTVCAPPVISAQPDCVCSSCDLCFSQTVCAPPVTSASVRLCLLLLWPLLQSDCALLLWPLLQSDCVCSSCDLCSARLCVLLLWPLLQPDCVCSSCDLCFSQTVCAPPMISARTASLLYNIYYLLNSLSPPYKIQFRTYLL
jgi:hypothetical protein